MLPQQTRVLITGVAGFCGRHLASYLLGLGYDVVGFDRESRPHVGLTTYAGDITDNAQFRAILGKVQPDVIFHLAALIDSRLEYHELHRVNALGTQSLFDAMRQVCPDASVIITSSSAVYGLVNSSHVPIRETQPFRPLNAYAVSKIAQEMLAYTYYAHYGLKVILTRAFNLVGPGQSPSLVCSAFAKQIAEIEAGQAEPVLRVGNLAPQRDFIDVRDVARAYCLLAQTGQPGEVYNVCSGKAISIQACLDELLRLTQKRIRVEQDPDRMRSSDIPISVGDNNSLREQTGWRPTIPLEQSLADLLDDWRRQI